MESPAEETNESFDLNTDKMGLVSGWPNIARFIDRPEEIAKELHYTYGMPVSIWPDDCPVIIPDIIIEWILEFNRLMNEKATGNDLEKVQTR